jgi:hypothetical protein
MIAVDGLIAGHLATVEGLVNEVDDTIKRGEPVGVVVVGDDSGELRLTFSAGRGGDVEPGQRLRITGRRARPATSPFR